MPIRDNLSIVFRLRRVERCIRLFDFQSDLVTDWLSSIVSEPLSGMLLGRAVEQRQTVESIRRKDPTVRVHHKDLLYESTVRIHRMNPPLESTWKVQPKSGRTKRVTWPDQAVRGSRTGESGLASKAGATFGLQLQETAARCRENAETRTPFDNDFASKSYSEV